ncbi:N-methyl-L-tryptophan oxidase [Salinisphaera sp. RV14]|uniref:N-methyl-L-tryptophan oxidase n=1 Tax=Salinisphaera sp. RV14 TaxID=3454140 RepID=UPI003F85F63A
MAEYDVAVVGLGAMGSATLHQLAKAGVRAIGIDRFMPPHTRGSSHGDTRITRQAIGEGPDYVPFVLRSHALWRELEAATGETIFNPCGTLIMAPSDMPNTHHGKTGFLETTIEAARAYGIEHELLGADEIAARFPQYVGLGGRERAYFEPGGGYVRPERAIAAQLELARQNGAMVCTDMVVQAIRQSGDAVAIETENDVIRAGRAVVSAGAWTAPLLGAPFDRLLTVSRQVLHWFSLAEGAVAPDEWPVSIWMHGSGDTDYFYSFPPLPGEASIKVATEQYASHTSADMLERNVGADESAAMFDHHVNGRIAGARAPAIRAAACLYTTTPDRGFILDWHPDMDRVFVISACSGHGFKHSAGIGEAVAGVLRDEGEPIDLAPFALSRFIE